MHPALMGALVGLALALVVLAADYITVRKNAAERGARKNRPGALDPTEKKGLASLARLCLILPAAFAFAFWLLS